MCCRLPVMSRQALQRLAWPRGVPPFEPPPPAPAPPPLAAGTMLLWMPQRESKSSAQWWVPAQSPDGLSGRCAAADGGTLLFQLPRALNLPYHPHPTPLVLLSTMSSACLQYNLFARRKPEMAGALGSGTAALVEAWRLAWRPPYRRQPLVLAADAGATTAS